MESPPTAKIRMPQSAEAERATHDLVSQSMLGFETASQGCAKFLNICLILGQADHSVG